MKRFHLVLVSLLLAISLILGGCSDSEKSDTKAPSSTSTVEVNKTTKEQPEQEQPQQEQQAEQTQQQSPAPLIEATVTRVVDGDTIHVNIDGKDETVRLIGVDTPETHHPSQPVEPYGPEAENYTRSQLDGKTVYLEKDVQERDKYGRLLAYIWLEKPTEISDSEIRAKMFNARLLLDGYAQVMTIPPNVKYVDYFTKYQQEAREKNVGLWAIAAAPAPSTSSSSSSSSGGSGSSSATYIGNSSSKKFHYPSCQWAQKISPSNRVYFNSRQEAINAGYVPCKVCKP